MNSVPRLSTGVDGLDQRLGGGLLPGTLTVIAGASGIGKTQLGLQFAHAGRTQEGRAGIVFDMSARIDPQGHTQYAQRMFDWNLVAQSHERFSADSFFDARRPCGDYPHVFDSQGRRVTERDMGFDGWHDWQAELVAKLELTIAFFYGNFARGTRRAVIDGIEPAQRQSESIQFELFHYIYHQILRKDSQWVARDLFRQAFRSHADAIDRHAYDANQVGALLLSTSHDTMLESLIERPLVDGDVLAAANTVIYMGKIREGNKIARGLFIAKDRGSACTDDIVHYTIDDKGLRLEAH